MYERRCWFAFAGGREFPAVRLQTGRMATVESHLDTGFNGLPTLRQLTLSLHIKLRRVSPYTPLLSYATEDSDNEILIELALQEKAINVICCGELVFEVVNATIELYKWQHICVSLDLSARTLRVLFDNVVGRASAFLACPRPPSASVHTRSRPAMVFSEYTENASKDDVYSGSNNLLVYEEEHTLTFRCHFDLQMYPFDRQRCSIIFKIQDLTEELCILVKDGPGVVFLGTRRLLEYYLMAETFSNFTQDAVSHVKVELEFKNLYRYYLGNTFLPTLMLVIICCITLCFDLADFQDRIMISLTSLLVLATFFVQTSQSITKTSYLKLIDVWFVALICEDFFIIVGLVIVESLRMKQLEPRLKEVKPFLAFGEKPKVNTAARVNAAMLVFFTGSLLVMLACFVPVCFNSLNTAH
ncbi:pH-sensitive chloride channel 2-like [Penaeus chinensis]|uniref:pH-sensitive chloride channel 2-like n=1 Tax=Penaeus chinensis TaxID=139456 RepID=UPI001FB5AF1B|nr:pH-sensitive chloride channel 2-like [Penaeus chinensis]